MASEFFVKINSDRGYGTGMFKVVGETGSEYQLFHKSHGTFTLYKAHTYQDRECKASTRKLNDLIGKKK